MAEVKKLVADKNVAGIIELLQNRRCLHQRRLCPNCHSDMKLSPRPDIEDKFGWRCSKCTKRISLRVDTFFSRFKLNFLVMMRILLHWAIQSRQSDSAFLSDCNRSSVVSFQQHLRTATAKAADQTNTVLGGVGSIVEIDESLYIKRRR